MEPVPILLETLARLSDPELEASAARYARREHRNGAAVIAHISEISRRDLHLKQGYRNLFEYVADRLGFQGGSAGLRIHVAKKVRDCPRLLEALWNGDLCLSGASLLVPHLTPENAEGLIRDSAHKSTREIEEMLRGVAPLPAWEPGIRRAPAPVRAEVLPPASEPERSRLVPLRLAARRRGTRRSHGRRSTASWSGRTPSDAAPDGSGGRSGAVHIWRQM